MPLERYEATGVNYDVLDAAKRTALASASGTSIKRDYGSGLTDSHGESAFVFKANGNSTLATVLECVGTKSLLAREYVEQGGPDRFDNVGFDAVAAIVNDLISVGALPLVLNAYFATGSADWYLDEDRYRRLVEGWRDGCLSAGAVWGGGESPTLSGIINDKDIEIAGSAVGFVPPDQEPVLGKDLAPGDDIVFVESTGLHTNGSSLVRALAARLPDGYRTLLPDGSELGEAALRKSALYVELVADLGQDEATRVTYYSHITGHGLRKLMRADRDLTYRIEHLPDAPVILSEICRYANMDDHAAYGTVNMGVGFAVFCASGHGARVVEIARRHDLKAVVAGRVEEGPKRVILEPCDVTFEEEHLQLRHARGRKGRRTKRRAA